MLVGLLELLHISLDGSPGDRGIGDPADLTVDVQWELGPLLEGLTPGGQSLLALITFT